MLEGSKKPFQRREHQSFLKDEGMQGRKKSLSNGNMLNVPEKYCWSLG